MEPASGLGAFVDDCLAKGNAHLELTSDELAGLRALAAEWEPRLAAVHGSSRLVHSDFNPKNLLARHDGDGWTVTAVLDWEFAFSGPPLVDIGNMLRFPDEIGPTFADGFLTGHGTQQLPDDWHERSPWPRSGSSLRASHDEYLLPTMSALCEARNDHVLMIIRRSAGR